MQTKTDPYAINDKLLGQRIIGGFPLKKFYPELGERLAVVLHGDHDQSVDRRGSEGGGAVNWNEKIRKATTHISQNEGLIFEKSSPGKKAYKLPPLDVPEVDAGEAAGRAGARGPGPHARGERDRNHPPLHAAFHVELRRGSRHVSAGLVHHEVQRARERGGGAADRAGGGASLSAGAHFARRAAHPEDAERAAHRNHRHGCDHLAARGRRAWRADRHPAGARVSGVAGQSAQEDPDSRLGARHQSGDGGDGRLQRREPEVECRRHGRHRIAGGAGERRCGGADADQSRIRWACSSRRSTRLPMCCTPRARCFTWTAPT